MPKVKPPRMPKPRPIRPVQLERLIARSGGALGEEAMKPTQADLDATLAYLVALRGGGPEPKLTIPLLRSIARAFPEVKSQQDRKLLLAKLVEHPATRWWELWHIWAAALANGIDLIHALVDRLAAAAERGAHAQASLPSWLPQRAEAIRAALEAPKQAIKEWAELSRVPLTAVAAQLQCPLSQGPGREGMLHLIRNGHASWWGLCSTGEAQEWAVATNPHMVRAVADRVLVDLGEGATGPGGLSGREGLADLRRWLDRHLGDPDSSPTHWAGVSERALQVYRWLALLQEFDKILEEFERLADRDRAYFWKSYLDHMDDARFHMAEVAVCMMQMGEVLVVEFGRVNNACFFYNAPKNKRRRLGQRPLGDGASHSKYFKDKQGLLIGAERLQRVAIGGNDGWLPHSKGGTWQYRFAEELRWLAGVPIPNPQDRGW